MVVGNMTVECDVCVIGSGPGGYVAAIRAAQLGKDVLVVEKEESLGGVCLNTGCIPSKALIHSSDYYYKIQDMKETGIEIKDYTVDIKKMVEWKQGVVTKLSTNIKNLFDKHGIEVIPGEATFNSNDEIHIAGKTDVSAIKFKTAIIATGSSQIQIPGFEFDGETVISSDEALSLQEIPKRMVIIGGGYIGMELGTVYSKLGTKVEIVEMADHIVPVVPKALTDVVARRLQNFNAEVHLKTKALGMEKKGKGAIVKIEKDGKEQQLEADKVLVVVGRKPNSKGLGLENTDVEIDDHGFIKINQQCKTKAEKIYAIGDVTGNPMLAHRASRQGKVAAEAIAGEPVAYDNKVCPAVVFNDPEIASVGLTEDEAKEKGIEIKVGKFPVGGLGRAMTMHEKDGFIQVIADKATDAIIGVHAVGPNVSDIISEASLAIEMGATLDDVALTIHPHPTIGEGIMEAAEVALGTSVHIFSPPKKD